MKEEERVTMSRMRARAGGQRRRGKIGAELKMTDTVKRCAFAMFRMGASTRDVAKAIGVTTATVYVHFPGGPAKWRKR